MYKAISLAVGLLALAACSGGDEVPKAEAAVTNFHRQLDAGQVRDIYSASSTEMKSVSSEAEFEKFLTVVHAKLGKVKAAKQQGWRVNYGTGGGTVALAYQTQFERGSAAENFVYRTGGDGLKLEGYQINSNALIVN